MAWSIPKTKTDGQMNPKVKSLSELYRDMDAYDRESVRQNIAFALANPGYYPEWELERIRAEKAAIEAIDQEGGE